MKNIPESFAAESAVVGSMIIEPACIAEVTELISESDFVHEKPLRVYEAIMRLWASQGSEGIDAITVRDSLGADGFADFDFIKGILETTPTAAAVLYYAKILKRKTLERELITHAEAIRQAAYDTSISIEQRHSIIENAALQLPIEADSQQVYKIGDLVPEAMASMDSQDTGLKTGFNALDAKLNSICPGNLIYIAARPSMGKTSFMLECARRMAYLGRGQIIFSLEMNKQQLTKRLICQDARIGFTDWQRGLLTEQQKEELKASAESIKNLPLYIDDTAATTPAKIKARIYKTMASKNIEAAWIDYISLMHDTGETRQQEIATISRKLKLTAMQLNIPILVVSQLSRAPELRENHRPRLSDLRESGGLEQDADCVLLIYRADKYRNPGEPEDGTAEVIIDKQRNGACEPVKLVWLKESFSFGDFYEY